TVPVPGVNVAPVRDQLPETVKLPLVGATRVPLVNVRLLLTSREPLATLVTLPINSTSPLDGVRVNVPVPIETGPARESVAPVLVKIERLPPFETETLRRTAPPLPPDPLLTLMTTVVEDWLVMEPPTFIVKPAASVPEVLALMVIATPSLGVLMAALMSTPS